MERVSLRQRVEKQLRATERNNFPNAGKERDTYEKQQQMLSNPATRETYVHELREKVAALVPQQSLPEESLLLRYEPTAQMFARKRQIYTSDHNIAHHGIVMVGSLLSARYLENHDPQNYGNLNEDALLVGASLHDTQRHTDAAESVIMLQLHAKLAIRRMKRIMPQTHIVDDQTQDLAKQIIRYHDVDKKQLGSTYTSELGIVAAADRAALGRLFSSKHTAVRLFAGMLTSKRMRAFKNGGIASNPEMFGDLIELSNALDIMVKQKISQGYDPKKQFQLVIDCAKELGMVASDK